MRSDLIAAAMIQRWLIANAPELINGWSVERSPELDAFVERVSTIMPGADAQFVLQASVAHTAIELWNLTDVALLGGGMPTPLTPSPDKIKYYTDLSAEAVTEGIRVGYNARIADVRKLDDLKGLSAGKTALASGLFHFLDDEAARQTLSNLAEANFHTLVFNNGNPDVPEDFLVNWKKMGYQVTLRSPKDVPQILVSGWRLVNSMTMPEFFKHNNLLGSKLINLPSMYDIYRLVRD